MQAILWQYRQSAKRNALFVFIWAHIANTLLTHANTIKQGNRRRQRNPSISFGCKISPGSFSIALSHVSLAFAWRMPGGNVHWPAQNELQQLLLKVVSLPICSTDLSRDLRDVCRFLEVTPTLTLTLVKLRSRSFATRFASGFESKNNLKGKLDITTHSQDIASLLD